MEREYEYPLNGNPPPRPQIRIGAYKDKRLQIDIPCSSEYEATACGEALKAQGYEVRVRTGCQLPETIEGEE